MSNKSNNQGRAYEFSYLITLFEEISKIRPAKIEENKLLCGRKSVEYFN